MNVSTKKSISIASVCLAAFAGAFGTTVEASDQPIGKPNPASVERKPSIVLVHGAFADGSSWSQVIPLLEKDGFTVTAVQNPLTSLADDIATTKRAIEKQSGPVVAVGHSYGGAVITGAAAESPNVKALVYIAAFAPDAGEAIGLLQEKFAPPALASTLVPDSAGFLFIDREKFHEVFAEDIPSAETRIMAATQKPIMGAAFAQAPAQAEWRTLPSWYLVATEDKAINPELERFMAKRIGATTTEIASSHVPFLSHPRDVAKLIEQAARSVGN